MMSASDCLYIAGVVPESIVDGPGIRSTVFVQGCPHHCEGCHNPDSHEFGVGRRVSPNELFEEIRGNPLLAGVTFSGGEPMCQAGPLARLAGLVKSVGLEVAVYTGYSWEHLVAENAPDRMALISLADVLVDGQFRLAERSLGLGFRGSANQRVINPSRSLAAGSPVLELSNRWVG